MSIDRELLELAAKAAGLDGWKWCKTFGGMKSPRKKTPYGYATSFWNPLTDDGDALRLAMDLGLVVDCSRPSAGEPFKMHHFGQEGHEDIHAATRRAIVRAAASLGEKME